MVVGDWSARCDRVSEADCDGVARLFINNLARSGTWVLQQSHGLLTVEPMTTCPALPEWADPSHCGQAVATVTEGPICMVIARQSQPNELGFGQFGGDDMSGRLADPPRRTDIPRLGIAHGPPGERARPAQW